MLDINGTELRSGQHVAWATVEMGLLATGVVQHLGTRSVKVALDSNGRSVYIPWNPRKFVVLSYDSRLDLDHQEDTGEVPETCHNCGKDTPIAKTWYTFGGTPYCDTCYKVLMGQGM